MLDIDVLQVATFVVIVVIGVAWYLSYAAARLDRLHAKVEGAMSALDAQLVRRAEATLELANSGALDPATALLLADAATESIERTTEHALAEDLLDGQHFGGREEIEAVLTEILAVTLTDDVVTRLLAQDDEPWPTPRPDRGQRRRGCGWHAGSTTTRCGRCAGSARSGSCAGSGSPGTRPCPPGSSSTTHCRRPSSADRAGPWSSPRRGRPRIGPMTDQQNAPTTGTTRVKRGMAEMLKGGVIMDVVTAEQAKIAEDAGAVAVMALERVPADIRAQGGVVADERPRHDRQHHRRRLHPGHGQGPHRPLRRGAGPAEPRRRLHRRVRGPDPGRLRQPHRQVGVHRARSSAARPTSARRCAASPRARR